MKIFKTFTFLLLVMTCIKSAFAVSSVNPSGVNVNHTGPSTVFLTFRGLNAGEVAAESFWCGAVTSTAPSNTNPCVAGTIFGQLPAKLNLSQTSSAGSNFTDIMTIPSSVSRRAFQDARKGNDSDFFYVRRFVDGATNTYIVVTCRMAGGGARVPLSLLDVNVQFRNRDNNTSIYMLPRAEKAESLFARIYYNGSGRLKGRWEVMLPGDPEPTQEDLLTEATLPLEKRHTQRRYTVLDRFDIFLPPTGKTIIPGPDPRLIPSKVDGHYKILLRIEATREKEGNSDTGSGVVASGGVAGFPMPVLRYYVASDDKINQFKEAAFTGELQLIKPEHKHVHKNKVLEFSWIALPEAHLYRIEITADDSLLNAAIIPANITTYIAPPWVKAKKNSEITWKVEALAKDGSVITSSQLRRLIVK